jgi:hypothetical protein
VSVQKYSNDSFNEAAKDLTPNNICIILSQHIKPTRQSILCFFIEFEQLAISNFVSTKYY